MSVLSMFAPRRLVTIARVDALNVMRDPMLMFVAALSVLPALGFWAFETRMNQAALEAFAIAEFSRYLASIILLLPAVLLGWVAGFLLLEDRDDGPIVALDVTPPGKLGFLAYRLAAAATLTALVTAAAAPVLVPGAGVPLTLLIVVLVALEAMAVALVLPAVARNKVEGLALSKLVNLATVVPLLALVPSPLRLIGGIIPTYWLGELLLPGEAGMPMPLAAGIALAVHAAAVWGLAWLLTRRTG